MVNHWLVRRYSSEGGGWEAEMDNGTDTGERLSVISDTELLRRIGQDLRSIYAEVIRQPLPKRIQATLALIDPEQKLSDDLPYPLTN